MKIIFAPTPVSAPPTFNDVDTNQFFVNICGQLCQKRTSASYCIIAASGGMPFCDFMTNIAPDASVKRILPQVQCIEF
jgi:hypothetical protein